ncbi:MAG TPA: pantoate--beta-alanine ligase [Candidatus Saccharimonadales bacterium]|nr:pantoate--beta-alanine ligase [Candidatus Saccharimonadales bacterium]
MQIVTRIGTMQRLARQWQRASIQIAFVPTMGYLHRGHISLAERARRAAGRDGKVVLSIYVNPTQFAAGEDLSSYPRDLANDKKLCRVAGVDALFVPGDREMYPAGFSTYVMEEILAQGMEGAARPSHFRGVATVVAKLFHIVLPDAAVFGAKDFQQAAIMRRMSRDLNFPVKIITAPTVREPDGLALSSRNKYLSPAQRRQATVLWRAIQHARNRAGQTTESNLRKELHRLIKNEPEARLDYLEFFDPATLEPAKELTKGAQMALAVFIGRTRLIDNGTL